MKPKEQSKPSVFVITTLLLMLLSVSSMLVVGLASGFVSPLRSHPVAQGTPHPAHSSQGAQMGALRGRITRWVAYFARSG